MTGTVAWISHHCRVTVQRLFSKNFRIARNVEKTLFDSQPTVAWPPTTVAWPYSDFFQNNPKLLETSKNVVWLSADRRVTSDDCPATFQRHFFKIFPNCLKRRKKLFDSRPTVAWPLITVALPFNNFFQNLVIFAETSKESGLTVGRRSRDLWPLSQDPSATFFPKIFDLLETSKECCLTISRRSCDLQRRSRDRLATIFKIV